MTFSLRPYQEAGIKGIKSAFNSGHKAVLFSLATGGGKTRIFSHIAERANSLKKTVLILVHRQELVVQSSLSLADIGVTHRLIAPAAIVRQAQQAHMQDYSACYIDTRTDIIVASVQTLIKNLHKVTNPHLIVIDEAHHACAGSWLKIIRHYERARLLGVTATPIRLDGKGLSNIFGCLVNGISIQSLIEQGYLCAPRVFAPPQRFDEKKLHTQFGDFNKKELDSAMSDRTITGDAVEHYRALCDKVPAIAFCVSVTHAEQVAQEFRAAGYRAYSVDGKTEKNHRRNLIKALGRGEIDVLTSCDIISEGVDVPLVGAAILLRPTQSLALYMQQVGRVLRPYPNIPLMSQPHMKRLIQNGMHYAYILDHAGNVHRHGLPQAEREWKLTVDKVKRAREVMPWVCEQCKYVYDYHPICPNCGHEHVVTESDGEGGGGRDIERVSGTLDEINLNPDWAGGHCLVKTPLRVLMPLARTEEHLRQIATARGYKQGWVYHRLNEMEAEQKQAAWAM